MKCVIACYELRAGRVELVGVGAARRGGGGRAARDERLRGAGILAAGLRAREERAPRAPTAECRAEA